MWLTVCLNQGTTQYRWDSIFVPLVCLLCTWAIGVSVQLPLSHCCKASVCVKYRALRAMTRPLKNPAAPVTKHAPSRKRKVLYSIAYPVLARKIQETTKKRITHPKTNEKEHAKGKRTYCAAGVEKYYQHYLASTLPTRPSPR